MAMYLFMTVSSEKMFLINDELKRKYRTLGNVPLECDQLQWNYNDIDKWKMSGKQMYPNTVGIQV